ncbi:DUF4192 domain-containing protein [Arthrobacter sp. TMN-37]
MTPDPARLHLDSAADLLAYIPHALGFLPEESLVVLTLSGGRVGATLRVDLPVPGADAGSYAESVAAILASDTEADGAVMALYTGARWSAPGRPPYRREVRELDRSMRAAGTPLRDGWLISPTGWREYFCGDDGCCPWPGRPLEEIADSTASAELVLRGSSFSPSAETAAAMPPAAPAEPPVEELAAAYRRRCARTWTTTVQFRATLDVWDRVIAGPRPPAGPGDADTAAFLLAGLSCRAVRDSVLVLAGLGREAAEQGAHACGVLRGGSAAEAPVLPAAFHAPNRRLPEAPVDGRGGGPPGGGVGEDPPPGCGPYGGTESAGACGRYVDFLAGRSAGAPRWESLDGAYDLLLRLAAVSSGESQAAVLTMLGWIEFARGRGSLAWVYLERADGACPGYRLARLLKELTLRGVLPAWARRPDTSWGARRRQPG